MLSPRSQPADPVAGSDPPAVQFDGIGVVRDEAVLLLEATGSVDTGGILAVTGPNGAGKTTLLRTVAGILEPTSGQVRVNGRVPDDRDCAFRRSLAALIGPPQTARDLTIAEHLQFIAATWGARAGQAREQAGELLAELDIAQLGSRYPHELSSGQTQLASIALTLARPFDVLVLDEPEQRLDPDRLGLVIAALQRRTHEGAALMIASHSPRLVDELATDVLEIDW
ncbi:ABC transporter ATP-binding protein [Brachybacterium muris]|uniref:ABC transporter ATP-binding protein n=1 Tax=Brachybacterium muris TaxID=219301 RepID=UPI001EF8660B|nr:ABC transporter ATP-binding protein [Brachybacterium muris]MBM7499810.1 ABC-type multidrug transport system ATPase subunit [Brachybacterium muris]MCT1653881.1 ABC transporter ATP-binding protein [Brachybacterium muris]MCT1999005.1 ABC transporter ATP-binding protein [Brachybacterium muris]MCT2261892.1 ABC transporter ATP-binding protein [Brachybacterium muris]